MKYLYLYLTLLTLFAQPVFGQKIVKKFMERNKDKKQAAIDAGNPWLSPLFGPGYNADVGFLVAGGILYSFKTDKQDSLIQRSSIPATIFASTTGAIGINASVNTFWNEDKFRFMSKVAINSRENNYYGKGFDQIEQNYQSDSTTLYSETKIDITVDPMFRIAKNFYIGPSFNFYYASNTDVNPVMQADPYYSQFSNSYFMNGLGFNISYDSRDITVNAWKGIYFNFNYYYYSKLLGSDYNAQLYNFDVRYYKTFIRKGNVIASRIYMRDIIGEVPINMLSDFAGQKSLRGYIVGQYRDNTAAFFEVEWRHTFMNKEKKLSKSGIVAWVGAGSVAPDPFELTEWLPNAGVGYRYELQPRMNVGLDVGFGRESHGLYFLFTESF